MHYVNGIYGNFSQPGRKPGRQPGQKLNFDRSAATEITLYHSAAVQTFVLVTALYGVFFVFTVTMRLSLFLLNEHDDDDDLCFNLVITD